MRRASDPVISPRFCMALTSVVTMSCPTESVLKGPSFAAAVREPIVGRSVLGMLGSPGRVGKRASAGRFTRPSASVAEFEARISGRRILNGPLDVGFQLGERLVDH